jgi:hypothetical protein
MSQQPETTVPSLALGPASLPGPEGEYVPSPGKSDAPRSEPTPATGQSEPPPQRIPRWLEETELFLRITVRILIGLVVFMMPWWREVWDQNLIFLKFPDLGVIAFNGAVRGLVSGLGLLNLWIAFQDALRRGRD